MKLDKVPLFICYIFVCPALNYNYLLPSVWFDSIANVNLKKLVTFAVLRPNVGRVYQVLHANIILLKMVTFVLLQTLPSLVGYHLFESINIHSSLPSALHTNVNP